MAEPVQGRLDRMLAEWADKPSLPAPELPMSALDQWDAMVLEIPRLRAMVVALEAECTALADALGDPNVTHPFTPMHPASLVCGVEFDDDGSYCSLPSAAAVHRTPAVVRAELGDDAT